MTTLERRAQPKPQGQAPPKAEPPKQRAAVESPEVRFGECGSSYGLNEPPRDFSDYELPPGKCKEDLGDWFERLSLGEKETVRNSKELVGSLGSVPAWVGEGWAVRDGPSAPVCHALGRSLRFRLMLPGHVCDVYRGFYEDVDSVFRAGSVEAFYHETLAGQVDRCLLRSHEKEPLDGYARAPKLFDERDGWLSFRCGSPWR